MPKSVYLIDGHSQIYRAYYAPFRALSAPSGEPTRATYVFSQMLLNLLRDHKPDYLVMVMDTADETVFRRDISADYKAHRDPPPEDLPVQIDRIVSILEAVGIPILRCPGYEADDIIATLVRRLRGGKPSACASGSDNTPSARASGSDEEKRPQQSRDRKEAGMDNGMGTGVENATQQSRDRMEAGTDNGIGTGVENATQQSRDRKGAGSNTRRRPIAQDVAVDIPQSEPEAQAEAGPPQAGPAASDPPDIYIVSRDKDLDQLLAPGVSLYDPLKDELITADNLLEKKGWTADKAIEVQCLVGDNVDNVPGVPGIGPKTAAKLIAKYGSAQAVIDHADELTPKQRENVLAYAPKLETSRRLLTLHDNVPCEFDLSKAAVERFDWSAVADTFRELGFRRLLDQLPGGGTEGRDRGSGIGDRERPAPDPRSPIPDPSPTRVATAEADPATAAAAPSAAPEKGRYECVNTPERLDRLAKQLAAQPAFAFGTQSTGIAAIDAELVGVAVSWLAGEGCYVPVRSMRGDALPLDLVRARLGPLLDDPNTLKIGHNLKYDMIVLRNAGMPVAEPIFDTMIASFVIDATRRSHAIQPLASGLLGRAMIPIADLLGKGRDQLRMDEVPTEHVCEYAAEGADIAWRLRGLFEPQLAERGLAELFHRTEMPLVSVLAEMEYNGIAIDSALLRKMSHQMAAEADRIAERVYELAGQRFNIDSPKQVGEMLFDRLAFRVVRRTKTTRSTDAETLEMLANETRHELPRLILDYREIQKLRGTYTDALPKSVSVRTGRIHTSYHQTGAVTGRLSSSEPNLQNIPIRTAMGREIRRAFIPSGVAAGTEARSTGSGTEARSTGSGTDAPHVGLGSVERASAPASDIVERASAPAAPSVERASATAAPSVERASATAASSVERASAPASQHALYDKLIVADYSQIELRILAHFCRDEALIRAFTEDLDIHVFVAAQVNGVALADVSREMRDRAKAVNFGIIYGQTAFGLARGTGMTQTDARRFIDDYFNRYPRIRGFIDQCIEAAKRDGAVTTILGRRREIDGIHSRNRAQRALAERLAVNTVIQGSAADMIKTAMNHLHHRIAADRLPLRMLLQVHDELVCETPAGEAPAHARLIEETMRTAIPLSVPVKVEAHLGDNWLDAK